MIRLIDYEAGNLASVSNALNRLGVPFEISDNVEDLSQSEGIILPGVGHAGTAMNALQRKKLDIFIKETTLPVFGICVGMQLFFEHSEEGDAPLMHLLDGRLKRFNHQRLKVPQMGWNTLSIAGQHSVFEGIENEAYVYFVHSFYAPVVPETIAVTEYGHAFSAAIAFKNYWGVQFHPEKSGDVGARILENFIKHVKAQR